MTVFGDDPLAVAKEFAEAGAEFLHVVDLDGAKDGDNPNFDIDVYKRQDILLSLLSC